MHDTLILDYGDILILNNTYSVLAPCKVHIGFFSLLDHLYHSYRGVYVLAINMTMIKKSLI